MAVALDVIRELAKNPIARLLRECHNNLDGRGKVVPYGPLSGTQTLACAAFKRRHSRMPLAGTQGLYRFPTEAFGNDDPSSRQWLEAGLPNKVGVREASSVPIIISESGR